VADVANPSYPDFIRGIEDIAIRERCTLLLCNTDASEARQIEQMRSLIDRQVDGMVLLSQHCESAPIRNLLDCGIPFVLVQRRSTRFTDNYVGADNEASIAAAVEHLASLGHRRIGYVRGPAESSAVAERLATFQATVARLGLDASEELIFPGDYGTEAGYKAASALLDLRQPPTAIMASNDMNALGVLDAAAERNIAVPGQLSVVGYDDIALARLMRISLTTINLPKREMGAAAAKLLMKQIASGNRRLSPRSVIFPTTLVIRNTTGPRPRPSRQRTVARGDAALAGD
jgi:LacI family transcriptional regulator